MPNNKFAAKDLWRWCYAGKCFEQVAAGCDFLSQATSNLTETVQQIVVSGVVVTYFKPFTHCKGVGGLSPNTIPPKFKATHEMLADYRNMVVAHLDALDFQADDPSFGNINQVRLVRTQDDYDFAVLLPASIPQPNEVKALAKYLEEFAQNKVESAATRLSVLGYSPGHYKLSLQPDEPMFLPL